jgi:hypothetical protein
MKLAKGSWLVVCLSQHENSHANRTQPFVMRQPLCFIGSEEPSLWVRFPSPAPFFIGWRWPASVEGWQPFYSLVPTGSIHEWTFGVTPKLTMSDFRPAVGCEGEVTGRQ